MLPDLTRLNRQRSEEEQSLRNLRAELDRLELRRDTLSRRLHPELRRQDSDVSMLTAMEVDEDYETLQADYEACQQRVLNLQRQMYELIRANE
jgi:chromosome segregation ATPase